MGKPLSFFKYRIRGLSALSGLALCLQAPLAFAQGLIEVQTTETIVELKQKQALPLEQRAQVTYDAYILGPGDSLQIELLDLPELSGRFSIGPDGTLYLPRLRALYVEGLTVEELRYSLTQQFSTYVRDPQVYVRPVVYRPIRIYVGGEVRRPGYYTLSRVESTTEDLTSSSNFQIDSTSTGLRIGQTQNQSSSGNIRASATLLPTVFDAIRTAQGITPYSDLAQVQVTRKRAQGLGGGRIRTNLNLLSLITEGNESQNIRLFDGDVVSVKRSNMVLREQLLKAVQTNLSPQFINVFVSGRVKTPGGVTIPQGSVLNQAIAVAGGPQLLKGKVRFVRFTREGEIDQRIFRYSPSAAADAPNNPVLMAGDLITIQDSPLSATTTLLNELTSPAVGIYSIYSLFDGISQ